MPSAPARRCPVSSHPSTRAVLTLALGLGLATAGSGCGRCGGAIRQLRVYSVEACGSDECREENGVVRVGPDMNVRIVGDGPNEDSSALLADSGIGPASFFLLDDDDARVAVTIAGDAGGHSCRNGVGFGLQPDAPLPPGAYTLVLLIDDLDWPLVGGAATQTYEGRSAFVRELEVVAAPEG
jgi:hypothetical protein